MTPLIRPLRSIANGFGLAWWARVETRNPDVTYWFGPYLRRNSLESSLPPFLADLRSEGASEIQHTLVRARRGEPLTISAAP
ncbi:DUF1816 domain-containing protein [Vulcanococcus sp.]|jgi:hypothetical protein|uniref:DUF1816 domain-containing protein n=1 Tax=Vulcanococcus sp. TaxID=2856995 RepID=UPI003C0901EC